MSDQPIFQPISARCLRIALIVGPILTLINQRDALFDAAPFDWLGAGLTFLVPYCVALWSQTESRREAARLSAEAERRAP